MKKLPDFKVPSGDDDALREYVKRYGYADAVMSTAVNRGAYETVQMMLDTAYRNGGDEELGITLVNASKSVADTYDKLGASQNRSALIGFAVTALYLGWQCERRFRERIEGETHAHSENDAGKDKK